MRSTRDSRAESVSASRHRRRLPRARYLLAISMCILVAALLVGAAAPAPAQAVGTISGTVRDADGIPLAGVLVQAYRDTGGGTWVANDWAFSAPVTGAYTLTALSATGNYAVGFNVDNGSAPGPNWRNLNRTYLLQWWNNKPTPDLAALINVTGSGDTSNINATLAAVAVDTTDSTYAQGEQVTVEWSTERAVAGGEFGVYIRSSVPAFTLYPTTPTLVVPAVGTDFSADFTLPTNVPVALVGSGYQAYVAYRSSSTSDWNTTAPSSLVPTDAWASPTTFAVTAGFTTTVDAVTGSYNVGDIIDVSWTTSRDVANVAGAQFGIWARSGSGVYSPLVAPCFLAASGVHHYTVPLPLSEALPGAGYQIVVGYRPTAATAYRFWGTSSGSFTVGMPSINVTAPTGGTFSDSVTVNWTTNAPVTGQFGIWVRSGSGVWSPVITTCRLPVTTSASSFSAVVDLSEADAGPGFQAIVAYRPGIAPFIGPWIAWGTGATFNVIAADFVTVTTPALGASYAQSATITVRWTLAEAPAAAALSQTVWLRDATETTWYGPVTGPVTVLGVLTYQQTFDLTSVGNWTVLPGTGYAAVVSYNTGAEWGTSAGFTVTARR